MAPPSVAIPLGVPEHTQGDGRIGPSAFTVGLIAYTPPMGNGYGSIEVKSTPCMRRSDGHSRIAPSP